MYTEDELLQILLELDYRDFMQVHIISCKHWARTLSNPKSPRVENAKVLHYLLFESKYSEQCGHYERNGMLTGKKGYGFLMEVVCDYIEDQVIFLPGDPFRVDVPNKNRIHRNPLPQPQEDEEIIRIGQMIGGVATALTPAEGARLLANLTVRWFAMCDIRVLCTRANGELEVTTASLREIMGDRWY